jgi:hypothetical protein
MIRWCQDTLKERPWGTFHACCSIIFIVEVIMFRPSRSHRKSDHINVIPELKIPFWLQYDDMFLGLQDNCLQRTTLRVLRTSFKLYNFRITLYIISSTRVVSFHYLYSQFLPPPQPPRSTFCGHVTILLRCTTPFWTVDSNLPSRAYVRHYPPWTN